MTADSPRSNHYSGRFPFAIDDKRRTQVPSKWRSGDPEAEYMVVLWPHAVGKYLRVLDSEGFQRLEERLAAMPPDSPQRDALRRLLGGNSELVKLHSGRITIPGWLAELAELKDQAVLVGVFNCFEIWNPELFAKSQAADLEATKDVVLSF